MSGNKINVEFKEYHGRKKNGDEDRLKWEEQQSFRMLNR